MNISMKHLVITILSIFLALALGIFIGIVINTGNSIETQTGNIIKQIEDQLQYLRDENNKNKENIKRLEKENNQLDYALGNMSNKLINEQLTGKTLSIISLNEDIDSENIKSILINTGVEIKSNVKIKNDFYKQKKKIEEIFKGLELEYDNIYDSTALELSKVVLNSESSDLIVKLVENDLIEFEGDYFGYPEEVVILGGNNTKELADSEFKTKLFESLKNSERPVLGIQESNMKNSDIEEFKQYGFSTVDNVDTNTGKLSMVVALKGIRGNYGQNDSDDIVVPDLTILD
ncbi:MAG: copper transporter [Andreesenia angusta]|nr:copper transporter [Andreesenia angusta]